MNCNKDPVQPKNKIKLQTRRKAFVNHIAHKRNSNIPKLKKVGKTTRPFRYDLNQIPYDYTVELRNRFKGLDLIDKSA